jgi:hypothetical protein
MRRTMIGDISVGRLKKLPIAPSRPILATGNNEVPRDAAGNAASRRLSARMASPVQRASIIRPENFSENAPGKQNQSLNINRLVTLIL